MDLTASTPDLQGRNVELLQLIERATNRGEDVGANPSDLIAEKRAIQAELRRRGHPIKAEARLSTPASKALAQNVGMGRVN